MFNFAWPYIWLLLPLPWFFWKWLPPTANATAAVRVPGYEQLSTLGATYQTRSTGLHLLLLISTWILLVCAAAKPQWIGDPIDVAVSGRDLMMAIDISGSMKLEDMEYQGGVQNRLSTVKRLSEDLIKKRRGDRIGLILFGTQAFLHVPLSFDRDTVNILLQEAQIGIAGEKTAIGDAIGLAIKRLSHDGKDRRDSHSNKQKILLLMTDGANTAGEVSPVEAARFAATQGMKIHTIGIGAEKMIVQDFFDMRRVNPSAELDEEMLREIATVTGGRYFRARDTESMQEIFNVIDQLEPIDHEQKHLRPIRELFHWPLSLVPLCAVLLFVLMHDLRITRNSKRSK